MPSPTHLSPHPMHHEVVDPVWLLKAIALVILGALAAGYITLCLLFYQGQWQLILHPELSNAPITSLVGLPAQPIRFDATDSGTPQLSGALLPAPNTTYTVLYLRGGDTNLSQSPVDATNILALHTLGLSVFAFDYRGFGQSAPIHPNQARMTDDAAAALDFLTTSRSIPEQHILLFGTGVGASLAATIADAHPAIPALILDSPGPPPLAFALADPRTRALPVHALFHEAFPLTSLATLKTPKLLISYPTTSNPVRTEFRSAAAPKRTVELKSLGTNDLAPAISRFLDEYLGAGPAGVREKE